MLHAPMAAEAVLPMQKLWQHGHATSADSMVHAALQGGLVYHAPIWLLKWHYHDVTASFANVLFLKEPFRRL